MEYINNIRKAKPSAWGVREYNSELDDELFFDKKKKPYAEFDEVFASESDMYCRSDYVDPDLDGKYGQEFELYEKEIIISKIKEVKNLLLGQYEGDIHEIFDDFIGELKRVF